MIEMLLSEVTLDNLQAAALRALQALEGANLYAPGPYPITVRPFATPPTVIYQAADGGAYERDMTPEVAGDSLNVVLGERRQVEAMTLWVPVDGAVQASFSAGQGMEGHQTKSGLIFRAGNYPDKGVEITSADIRAIVANFPRDGVALMSEHDESLIGLAMEEDGARVLRVWSEKGDTELHGEVRYPNWLAYGLRNLRNCVSVGLTAAKDGLRELSLVLNPRVADAAVFRHEAAVAFSATPAFQTFKAKHPSEAANIATEAAKALVPAPASEDMDKPTFSQRLAAFLTGKTPEQRAALTQDQIVEAVFSDTPGTPALPHNLPPEVLARIEAVETQNREFASQRTAQTDATDAANAYIRLSGLGKIDPVERDGFMASFCAIRKVDRTEPTFKEGTQGAAEKAFVGTYEARSATFRIGPTSLPSTGAINLSTDSPLGPFKESDFGAAPEAK